MRRVTFTWSGFFIRLFVALILVFATYNPEGYSYFHWIRGSFDGIPGNPISDSNALKYIAGIVLLIGWLVFLQATRKSLGAIGILVTVALCGGMVWLAMDMGLFTASNVRALTHVLLAVISIVLAVGISWSLIHARLTGQIDTDELD